LGRLVLSDPSKFHVVAVPTYEDLLWRWRIYVPPGQSLDLHSVQQNIPERGFPASYGTSGRLEEGEYVLTAAIRRDRNGTWQLTLARPHSSSSSGFGGEQAGWLTDSPGWSTEQAGSTETQVFDANEPIVLLRLRCMQKQGAGVSSTTPEPSDGVMIWIKKQ
jgi:hypothetical protein